MSPERKDGSRPDPPRPQAHGGAYGFRIRGANVDRSQLSDAPAHWPALQLCVRVRETPPASQGEHIGDRSACLRLRSGGSVLVDRASARATFCLPAPPRPGALRHPHLAAAALVAAHWRGHDSFHAGAFVAGGGVWGVLGERGSGKSSSLALLAQAGVPVLCDDLLVLDGITALAGPRAIDLRADAARALRAGEPLGVLGERERWRMALAAVAPELPLRGWVALRWGAAVEVVPLRGAERLHRLLRHRALRVPPPDPKAPVTLSALPFLELSRPRGWDSAQAAIAALLEAVERQPAATAPAAA